MTMNTITMANLLEKVADLVKYYDVKYYPYLAIYLIVHHVSLEPNFHQVYNKFILELKCKEFNGIVMVQTYASIKALLASDKLISDMNERKLLKNLGGWLGLITIAKDCPIFQRDLDIKRLLIDSFEKDTLLAIIPFVCNILNKCTQSTIFKPPNPWLMYVLFTCNNL